MKSRSGRIINRKFSANPGPISNAGNMAPIIITMIIIQNAMIKYLNFNWNSPIILVTGIIK
jgi:hypothetical protein